METAPVDSADFEIFIALIVLYLPPPRRKIDMRMDK